MAHVRSKGSFRRPAWLLALSSLAPAAAAGEEIGDAALGEWLGQRFRDLGPSAEERRFDEIGWSTRLLDAERLAAQHRRPVFWFSHDGRMPEGRC
jgi:hypothetical protein